MLIASDVDGTVDSDPQFFAWLFRAVRQAGGQVAILTGIHGAKTIGPADVQAKQAYLAELGIGCYDQLVVFPDDKDLAQAKADWCKQHGAAVLIDNSRSNSEAAKDVCLVLTPWATRMGSKKGD